MRRSLRTFGLVLFSLSLGGAAAPSPDARFMFPAFVVLQDGGVRPRVVLTHAGAVGMDVSNDTIAILYSGLTQRAPNSVEAMHKRRSIDVAEFFGPEYWSYTRDNLPPAERANHHSRIYLAGAGEPALWERPVVSPGGASAIYQIDEAGQRALAARGIKLK